MQNDFSFIPKPFTTITAYTAVTGALNLIQFVVTAFDAQEIMRHLRPDGTIQHAQVAIGNSVLMLSEANAQWPPMPVNLYIYLPDTDVSYRRALKAGATSIMEPADQDYGDRMSGVKDLCGNQWWIATPLPQAVPANLKERRTE